MRKHEKFEQRREKKMPEYSRQNNIGEKKRRGARKEWQWIDDETWDQIAESIEGMGESLDYKWDESLDAVANKIAEQKFDEKLDILAEKFE